MRYSYLLLSAIAQGTSSAAGSGSDKAEGSKNLTVRLVPFQSMPQSTQEELGKELFDDPLLFVDNVKNLLITCNGALSIPR